MSTWKTRLVEEQAELAKKITDLEEWLKNNQGHDDSMTEAEHRNIQMLESQLTMMTHLNNVLKARIDNSQFIGD